MLAGREPGEGRGGVVVPGRDDGKDVNRRVLDKHLVVGAGADDTVLARHLGQAFFRVVAKRSELELRMVGDRPAMHCPEPADPDDSDT